MLGLGHTKLLATVNRQVSDADRFVSPNYFVQLHSRDPDKKVASRGYGFTGGNEPLPIYLPMLGLGMDFTEWKKRFSEWTAAKEKDESGKRVPFDSDVSDDSQPRL